MSGVLCVMTPGEVLMLLWCVDNWDTLLKVRHFLFLRFKFKNFSVVHMTVYTQ